MIGRLCTYPFYVRVNYRLLNWKISLIGTDFQQIDAQSSVLRYGYIFIQVLFSWVSKTAVITMILLTYVVINFTYV